MTDARSMAGPTYTFDALDPSMPGTFVVNTITGTMHLVINDPAAESLVRRIRPQTNGEFVGDSGWLPAEYQEIRVGDEASFHFVRSEVYGEDPAYTDTWRRIPRVIRISLYEGPTEFPVSDGFGRPRGLPTPTCKEAS